MIELWFAVYWRTALMLAVFFLLGFPVVRWLRVRGQTAYPLAIVTGTGVLSLVVCLSSWVHLFTRATVLSVTALAGLASAWSLAATARASTPPQRAPRTPGRRGAYWLLVAVPLVAFSVLTLYPAATYDVTMYHFPLARLLIEHRGFVHDPFVRYSFFPQAGEAMFAAVLLLTKQTRAVQGVQLGLLASTVWLVWAWFDSHAKDVWGGLTASLLLLATPIVVFSATVAYTDLWMLVFTTAALILGFVALETSDRRVRTLRFVVVGFFLGQAASVKYQGIGVFVAFIAAVAIADRRRVSWLALVAGCAVVAIPWYLRTFLITGNPVYPLLNGAFGNAKGIWNSAEIAYQSFTAQRGLGGGIGGLINRIGYDAGLLAGLQSPQSDIHGKMGPLSPFLVLGAGGLALRPLMRDRRYVLAVSTGIVFTVLWVLASSNVRYALPAVACLAIAGGFVAGRIRLALEGETERAVRPIVWCAIAAVLLAQSLSYWRFVLVANDPPREDRAWEEKRARVAVPCYSGLEYLNARYGDRYSAYAVFCPHGASYARGRFMGDWFGRASYYRILGPNASVDEIRPDRFARRLHELGAEYVVWPVGYFPPRAKLVGSGRFRLVHADRWSDVYELTTNGVPTR